MEAKMLEIPGEERAGGDDSIPSVPSTAPPPQPVQDSGYGTSERNFDKGLKAWVQVLGAFFLWFNSWGVINTFGVFQTYYEERILSRESAGSIAWIGSIETFFLLFGGIVSGPLFDAGYFYILLPFGTFMIVFGYIMTSLASQYYQILLAQGVCVGIGTGCLFLPAVALMPQYFERRRALANGIAATGSSIGGVLYPIVFYKLQQEVGFAWATRALAFVCLGTGSVSIAVMRVRFKPKQRRAMLQLSAFREAYYSIYTLGSFFGMLGFYNFLVYIQPWAIGKRVVSANLGFYLLPILNAASTFGRITPNFLADHIGPLNMLVPAVGATALLAFCWIVVSSTVGIIILVFLYGFFSGGFVSLISVVMVVITKDLRTYGTRLGMFFAIASVAVLIGTPIGGVIVSDTDSYLGVQVFSGACLAVCTAITFLLRVMRSGPKFIYKT